MPLIKGADQRKIKLVSICSAAGWEAVFASSGRQLLLFWGLTEEGHFHGFMLGREGEAIAADSSPGFAGYSPAR